MSLPETIRCIYVVLPEGWGWLPMTEIPKALRLATGDGLEIESEEVYRSVPIVAKDGLDCDPVPPPGWLLGSRKIVPDEIKKLLSAYGAIREDLIQNTVFDVSDRGGNAGNLDHGDLSEKDCAGLQVKTGGEPGFLAGHNGFLSNLPPQTVLVELKCGKFHILAYSAKEAVLRAQADALGFGVGLSPIELVSVEMEGSK